MFNKFKAYAVRNPVTVGIGAMSVASVIALALSYSPAESAVTLTLPAVATVVQATSAPVIRPTTKVVDLSYLNSSKLGGVAGAYFGKVTRDKDGIVENLPDHKTINFVDNLQSLWNRKLAISGVTVATQRSAGFVVNRYKTNNPDYKGIKTFINQVDTQAKFAHESIDFPALCDKMKLDGGQCVTLKQVTGHIEGQQLVAYGMTEVMPTWNGNVNYVMLDTLLRNAGENFVQAIPALGDQLMSLGFYQFTSHAVFHADRVEGASFVNLYVKDKAARIPGSVIALQGAEHHRAAMYFATFNMARLVGRLNERETTILASGICSTTDITQFIATAHHMPTLAIKRAHEWIRGRCQKPITYYMGEHLTEYATKTKNNLEELKRHS